MWKTLIDLSDRVSHFLGFAEPLACFCGLSGPSGGGGSGAGWGQVLVRSGCLPGVSSAPQQARSLALSKEAVSSFE